MPAFVAILAPKTDEEAQRARQHARDYRLRMEIVNGTRAVTMSDPPLVQRNIGRAGEDYVMGAVA